MLRVVLLHLHTGNLDKRPFELETLKKCAPYSGSPVLELRDKFAKAAVKKPLVLPT